MTRGRSLSLMVSIVAMTLAIAIALSIPSVANAHPFGGPCVRITMVSADAGYKLHLVNENSTKIGLNNRQVGSSIVLKAPERIGVLIDHTGDVKWEHEHDSNGLIGFEDHVDNDFNDAVIRVEPVTCPSRNSGPAPTLTPTATALEVSFDVAAYTVNEGSSVTVTVNLLPDTDRSLEIPVSITDGTADSDDYSITGLTDGKLSLASGVGSASFEIEAAEDSDSGAESLYLSFGELPEGVSEGTLSTAQVTINDPVAELEVSFDVAAYTVNEGSSVTVTVNLLPDTDRSLEIPVSITDGTADSDDYSITGLTDGKLSLASGVGSASFEIEAAEDSDSGAESLYLSFGELPEGVSEGTLSTAQVTINDPVAELEVSFDVAAYTVNEGSSVTVTVNVLPDADRSLEIPVSITDGTADSDDYSITGLTDGKLSLASGVGSASFEIEAAEDSDSGAESLDLSFGELPEGVSEGTLSTAQVTINDPVAELEVSFDVAAYTVNEGSSVTVTVNVLPDADRSLEIPVSITDGTADSDDYSITGLTDGKLSLASGVGSASFEIEAAEDSDSGAESLYLSFGELPEGVSEGTLSTAQVTINDPVAELEVSFDVAAYTVNEGSSVTVTVNVLPDADRSLEIPVSITDGTADSDDYSITGLTDGKLSLASGVGSASFEIEAAEDSDSGAESLDLSFGELPEGVSEGTLSTAQVTINDPVAELEVSFDVAAYTVNEGSSVTVTVNVLPDADRSLEIPVSITDGTADSDDYSITGLTDGKLSLASGVGSASFEIEAAEDSDSGAESLDLSFGELPEGVSEGTLSTAQVTIKDAAPPPRSNTRSGSGGGGSYTILVQQTNQPPVFTEGANTQRSVAEDAANETNLGSPVSAIDPDGDILTYTLEGPDATSFSLNFATGQLATAVALDYETKVAHHLSMKVYDARGGSDTIVVTVRVTDAAEQPATVQAPVLTSEPQLVETLAPEPTKTPTPTPTPTPSATPVPAPTPKPTVALWSLQLQWPSSTSKMIPSPTATPEPTPTEDPTATPDLPGDSQSAMLTQFQAGGPMGDFQHTNVRSSVPLLPEKDRHLRIWPIILIAIGTAMMVVSLVKLITGGKEKVEFGNRDFILNS